MYFLNKMAAGWEKSEGPTTWLTETSLVVLPGHHISTEDNWGTQAKLWGDSDPYCCFVFARSVSILTESSGIPRPKGETLGPYRCQYSPQCIILDHPAEAGTSEKKLRTWKEAVRKGIYELLKTLGITVEKPTQWPLCSLIQQNYLESWEIRQPPEGWPICDWGHCSVLSLCCFRKRHLGLLQDYAWYWNG